MTSLNSFAKEHNSRAASQHRLRAPATTERTDGLMVTRDGHELLSFSCNDYFGLSQSGVLKEAAKQAIDSYGAGAGASRLITGNHPLYDELEAQLASMKGTESSCVFGSGYLANIGTIPTLVGKGDVIYLDKLAHACLIDGAQASGATVKRFKHNDMTHLKKLLAERGDYTNALIITETVFSMDGDRAPLHDIVELASAHDCWTMTDDAHGLGIAEPNHAIDVQMGTLSKAAGSYGGYVCASDEVITHIKSTARSLLFTTGLPPAVVAASLAALQWIEQNSGTCANALQNAQYFCDAMNLPKAQSAIVPLIIGDDKQALDVSEALAEAGFLVSAIRPPTVPEGTSRLRFAFSALHTRGQIDELVESLNHVL